MHRMALFLVLLLLVSCAADVSKPIPTVPIAIEDPKPATIITFAANNDDKVVYQPIISAFNTQYQDVQVQFIAIDPGQDVQQMVHSADTAAVSALDASALEAGYLHDISSLIEADASFDKTDFYPETLQAATKDGQLFLIPQSISLQTISYNKALLAQHAIDFPILNVKWSDFLHAAASIVKNQAPSHHLYGFFDDQVGLDSLLGLLNEAGFFTQSSEPRRLDRPAVVRALKQVADLIHSGAIYAPLATQAHPIDQLIREEELAAWPTHRLHNDTSLVANISLGTIAMPPLPGGRFMAETGYSMSNGTQHAEEAWRWLSFLSRYPHVALGSADLQHIPARRSMMQEAGYWDRLPADQQAMLQAFLDQEPPNTSALPDAQLVMGLQQALNAIVNDHQPAEQAARSAQEALDQQRLATPLPVATAAPFTVATPASIASAPAGSTSITFMANLGPAENHLAQIVESFNQQNVGIFVQLTDASQFQQVNAIAKSADCFAWYDPLQPNERSSVLDLQPLADADAAFQAADYSPQLLAPFQSSGALYGLPYMVTFRVLIYNQALFDAAGIKVSDSGWSLDEFLQAAQTLTNKGKGDYGFASVRNMRDDLLFFLDQFGVQVMQARGGLPQPNLTDPQVVQATRFFVDLLRNTSPHQHMEGYSAANQAGQVGAQNAVNGHIAMWFDFGSIGSRFYNTAGLNTHTALPPFGTHGISPHDVELNGLYISAATPHPEACWTWLQYLSKDARSFDGTFPARSSVAESDAFAQISSPDMAHVHRLYRQKLAAAPLNTANNRFWNAGIEFYWFYQAIDHALGGRALDQELAIAQQLTSEHLACVRGGGKPRTCALQVDPAYTGFLADS